MKSNTKSSITLPPRELALVENLRRRLGVKTKVEVVRRGLRLVAEAVERDALRRAYSEAAAKVRGAAREESDALDHLAGEGIE